MKPQTLKIDLGPVQLRISVGDADKNGCLDISLAVRIKGLFELPPFVQNLDAALAQSAIDGFKQVEAAFKGKPAAK